MREPILRAEGESGDVVVDPSEDALFMMFEDIERGEGSYLILDSLRDPTSQTFAQARRNDDGSYIVDYRQGSADQHFTTNAPDMRRAHELITGWAFDRPGWHDSATWTKLEF